ncbi:MAG: trypsin-like peptidase domain-containing protein [Gaiellaceae bacterium]
MRSRIVLPALGLLAAALLGGGATVGITAAVGGLGGTTTVRELQAAPSAAAPAAFLNGKALSINQIFKEAAPGVVQLTTTKIVTTPDPFFGFTFPQRQTEQALGAGFVIDKAGHIVTNYHVVSGARSVQVSFSNRDSMTASVVGSDPSTDIAVLKVDARSRALTPLPFGDSDGVRVGDSVVAIGNPFGLERTVTAGIVSALQREISAPNNNPIDHVIQTDAAINQGNSGGPLLNARGEVIGVNAQIATGGNGSGNVGIGFAIPIVTVRNVVAQIIKTGKVEHAYLGVEVKAVSTAVAKLFRLPSAGLLVGRVEPGSGAAKAGLRAGPQPVIVAGETYSLGGDLLVKADGVSLSSFDQLRDAIAGKKPGNSISLEVWRGQKKLTLSVKLGRQPSSPLG